MYLFKNRRGRTWITAAGVLRYFGVKLYEGDRKHFYNYDYLLKVLR